MNDQYHVLQSHYHKMDYLGKISLMSALTKYAIQEKSLMSECKQFLNKYRKDINPEMQQRAIEYYRYISEFEETQNEVVENVFDAMPTYSEEILQQNILLKVLKNKEKENHQEEGLKINMQSNQENIQSNINENEFNRNEIKEEKVQKKDQFFDDDFFNQNNHQQQNNTTSKDNSKDLLDLL